MFKKKCNSVDEKYFVLIKSLAGIEKFTDLKLLYCVSNNLTGLNISGNPNLTDFDCGNNNLNFLDLTPNSRSKRIICWNNKLTSFIVGENQYLTNLSHTKNQLQSIDISKCAKLFALTWYQNQ